MGDGSVTDETRTSGSGPGAAARLVEAAVAARIASGAVLAVGRGARTDGVYVFGETRYGPGALPVTASTVFDLASLTKVVATTPAVLRLHDAGELSVDDPVSRYLPAYADGAKAEVTLRHLLTHSAGLPAHRLFYEMPGTPDSRMAAAQDEPLAAPPGTRVEYSDISFILLGAIVAKVTGQSLDQAARELVFTPLGMHDTGYLPDPGRVFAATEPDPVTGEPKTGVVHDENADSLGGVAGHAGLFAPIGDLVRYVQAGWLERDSGFLTPATRAAATTSWTAGLDGRRGLGWTLAGDRWDHMTAAWPGTRAGHTGFTGTSIALDPVGGLWAVLLTNAVHLGRDHAGIILLRRTVHAAIAGWAEVDAATDTPPVAIAIAAAVANTAP
jgi:CubicO group peptidase (beta-lactamase class C family)